MVSSQLFSASLFWYIDGLDIFLKYLYCTTVFTLSVTLNVKIPPKWHWSQQKHMTDKDINCSNRKCLKANLGEERHCRRSVVIIPWLRVFAWSSRANIKRGWGLHWCWSRGGSGEHQGQVGALALDQSSIQAVGVFGGVTGFHWCRLGGLWLRFGPGGVGSHTVWVIRIRAGLVDIPQVAQVGLVRATSLSTVFVLEVGQVDAVHLLNLRGGGGVIGGLIQMMQTKESS